MKKMIGVLILSLAVLSACQPKSRVVWESYTPEVLKEARSSGKPVIAYFYAAWCPGCYAMKETTFADPAVIKALEPFRRIKFDMSFKRSPKVIEIGQEFQVAGLPMLIFFDEKGHPVEEFRIFGYLEPAQMLHGLKVFRERHPLAEPSSVLPPAPTEAASPSPKS